MHCAKHVRLTNIWRRKCKMSAKQSLLRSFKTVCCCVRLSCVFRAWHPMLYFTVYQAAFLNFTKPSWSVCSLARIQSEWRCLRFHERWKFEERMLTQLFTADSFDGYSIQALCRRLHPGGTIAVKWMLLIKPESSVDSI